MSFKWRRALAFTMAAVLTFSTGAFSVQASGLTTGEVQEEAGAEKEPEEAAAQQKMTAEGGESDSRTGDSTGAEEKQPTQENGSEQPTQDTDGGQQAEEQQVNGQNVDEQSKDGQQTEEQKSGEAAEDVLGNEKMSDIEEGAAKDAEDEAKETNPEETEADAISYVYVEQPYLETPGTQNVVISFADESLDVKKAVLTVKNETTGKTEELAADTIQNHLLLFSKEYTGGDGIYRLISLDYTAGEEETGKNIMLSEQNLGELTYGVNKELNVTYIDQDGETEEAEPELEAQVVRLDEDGEPVDGTSIAEAAEDAEEVLPQELGSVLSNRKDAKNTVVVLDPGHDATHKGAEGYGLKEEDLTLKIAKYCKEELETYSGVTVYMTRSTSACPYPKTTSTDDNKKRVEYAASVKADIFVSIHLNEASSSSANGAEVYYPNSNYEEWIGREGKDLASKIEAELKALGLTNRGIKIRNSGDGTKYPDGSLADYYGIIRNSKEAGFPAVIVEHAFLSNATDVATYLSSDTKLKALGVADATGIAEYLGLSQAPKVTFTYESMYVENIDHTNGTFDVVIKNVSPKADLSKIQFLVWSEKDGEDSAKTYEGKADSTGSMRFNISIANHGKVRGKYLVRAYAYDTSGTQQYLANTSCMIALYTDVLETSGWRYEAVKYVTDKGVMNGISGTTRFDPDENLTRAMFATIAHRMAGSPSASYSGRFPDVPGGNYFSVPISWASSVGIINGHSNTGLFGTYEDITREDMVTILYRYATYKKFSTTGRNSLSSFPDAGEVSSYAKTPMQWAVAEGIIKGRSNTGELDPKGTATRVEAAAVIQRFMQKYQK